MRAMLVLLGVTAALAPPGAVSAWSAPRVPDDVKRALQTVQIPVAEAFDVDPSSLLVTARRAQRLAQRSFGLTRGHSVGTYLVRATTLNTYVHGRPLYDADLAWIVVIRDVTVPLRGLRGGSAIENLVFVRTTHARWDLAVTVAR